MEADRQGCRQDVSGMLGWPLTSKRRVGMQCWPSRLCAYWSCCKVLYRCCCSLFPVSSAQVAPAREWELSSDTWWAGQHSPTQGPEVW